MTRHDSSSPAVCLATQAMGARWELLISPAGVGETHARAAGEEAIELIHDWHSRLTRFEPGSLVSRLNASAGERPMSIDDEFFELLQFCERSREATLGCFDITAGSVTTSGPPGIVLDDRARTIRLTAPGTRLDFGGVAKGWVLDRIVFHLRSLSIARAFIHGGTSSIAVMGAPEHSDAWQVAVPRVGTIPLRDACLSVSETREGTTTANPRNRLHITDPRDGSLIEGDILAACMHPSAAVAEVWSTALIVLRDRSIVPGDVRAWLADNPLEAPDSENSRDSHPALYSLNPPSHSPSILARGIA